MKIVIIGGHLTPALGFIDFLLTHHPQDKVFFLGREYSQPGLGQLSQEKRELEQRNLPFFAIETAKLSQLFSWRWPLAGWRLIAATVRAKRILQQVNPDVVLSFGGYLAVPVALAAWSLGIPIVTHEQTGVLGYSNRLIGYFARVILLARPVKTISRKTVVVGNPLRPVFLHRPRRPRWLPTSIKKPILYITGGNQGSLLINQTVARILPQLSKDWLIIHQCGAPTRRHNYQEELLNEKNKFNRQQQKFYFVQSWIAAQDLSWIYQQAQAVVSRAGANTLDELALWNKFAILIPLRIAYQQEQLLNARRYLRRHPGRLILEKDLSPNRLLDSLAAGRRYQPVKPTFLSAKKFFRPQTKIYQILTQIVGNEK